MRYNTADIILNRVAVLNDVQLLAQETDCLPGYIRKGISIACFFFARCLSEGLGIKQDKAHAKEFYSRVIIYCLVTVCTEEMGVFVHLLSHF